MVLLKKIRKTSSYVKLPKEVTHCQKCGDLIPAQRRSDAKYCTQSCRAAAEKHRYVSTHPEYVKRQRELVNNIRHMKEYGHLEFLDKPALNKRDKFALARSLGYRSMLEYNIAQQLTQAGIQFEYEQLTISYLKYPLPLDEDEDYQSCNTKPTPSAP